MIRKEPIVLSWVFRCASDEKAVEIKRWLCGRVGLDVVIDVSVQTGSSNGITMQIVKHRLGDYFKKIEVLPGLPETPSTFRLVFERHPDAPRYWKDLMVRIIHGAREVHQGTSIDLERAAPESVPAASVSSEGG